jgi:hypothetical protein
VNTQAERLTAAAETAVEGWLSVDRNVLEHALTRPAQVHKLASGGYLVEVGESFPIWRQDMGAVRRLLLDRDLITADLRS